MASRWSGASGGGENRLVSLPLSRTRVIMKSSPEVSSINPDAIFLTAKATVGEPCGSEDGPDVPAGREGRGIRAAAHLEAPISRLKAKQFTEKRSTAATLKTSSP